MKTLIFVLLAAMVLVSCKESDKRFAIGDCVNAVDGSKIWKLSHLEPLKGQTFENGWSENAEKLPTGRIFAEIPCPQ